MRMLLLAGAVVAVPLLAGAAESLPPVEEYVGSSVCGSCHQELHEQWRATFHSTVVQDARSRADALLGDFSQPGLGFTRDEVDLAIGGHWSQRYLKRIGDDYFALPKVWSVASQRWEEQDRWSWRKKPYSRFCVGCHATRYEPQSQTYVEQGVACEACHGPGRPHADSGGKVGILNPGRLPSEELDLLCASCHVRGTDPSGEYQFAVGYVPGRPLEDHYRPHRVADDETPRQALLSQYRAWQEKSRSGKPPSCDVCGLEGAAPSRRVQGESQQSCQDCHRFGERAAAHTRHPSKVEMQCRDCHQKAELPPWSPADVHSPSYFLVHRGAPVAASDPAACRRCHAEHTPEELRHEISGWHQAGDGPPRHFPR